MTALLEVEGLSVRLPVEGALRPVLRDVTFEVAEGQTLGLVGESGSGKSMTARTIARLLPQKAEVTGQVRFAGSSVYDLRGAALGAYRSSGVGMVFQDPRAHTNPVRRIGDFLTEALRTNLGMKQGAAERRVVDLLAEVGIEDGERRLRQYPHELSGGLLQRVMIAAAVAARPRLILADEPTTALDVTTQAEVVRILDRMRREYGLAMLFITHDLELARAVCDQTIVMYAGSIIEQQASERLYADPLHPYTAGLVQARPDISGTVHRLPAIPGQPTSAFEAPAGCSFAPRCAFVEGPCTSEPAPLMSVEDGRTSCRRVHDLRGHLMPTREEVAG